MTLAFGLAMGSAVLAAALGLLVLIFSLKIRRSREEPDQPGTSEASRGEPEPAPAGRPVRATGFLNGDDLVAIDGDPEADRDTRIYRLVKDLTLEVGEFADSIEEQALVEALARAASLRLDATANAQELVIEPARAQADARRLTIIADADRGAERIIAAASLEADEALRAAKAEAAGIELKTNEMVRTLAEELSLAASAIGPTPSASGL